MLSKIILVLSLTSLMGVNSQNNVKPLATTSGINSSSIPELNTFVMYEGSSNLLYLYGFEFGYVGKDAYQNVSFSYLLKNKNYNYRCKFLYTTNDGSQLGYDKTRLVGSFASNTKVNTSFVIQKSKLPKGNVYFNFMFYAYTKTSSGAESIKAHIKIDYYLSVYGTLLKANYLTIKSYYYCKFVENETKPEFYRYYDALNFESYSSVRQQEIYFRIKPEDFIYTNDGVFNSLYVKFFITNNNGSFNDCTDIDSDYGRYFLMDINVLNTNTYNLKYKNLSRGGTKNLYLDPFTMHTYSEKRNKYIEVNNIYLPKKQSESYETLKVMPVFMGFGSNLVNITIPFTIFFENNFIDNYFYTNERINETGNDSSSEVIHP
jgi:hypothetical protein